MLHELLLALSGYPGEIFIKSEDDHIEVAKGLPFIHPTEVALLNRICKIASHHSVLLKFIQRYSHVAGGGIHEDLFGLYMWAFCQGLDLVLDPYRQKLLGIERELITDPHLTAAYVQSQLEEYQLLFVALNAVVEQVQTRRVHGCNILEVLHKGAVSGTPIVTAAVLRIQHVCHGVLMKQLSGWMLHGMLLDKYGEFFIQKKERRLHGDGGTGGEETDEMPGLTGKHFTQAMLLSGENPDWSRKDRYCLHAEMLPSYIPTRVAEKILFVGESVQIFESQKGRQQRHRGSILHGKEDEFAKELHHLSQEKEFNLLSFEEVIDKIRSYVAEQLWTLVVVESDLMSQLRTMKDFYLLGRGELFLAFIDQAQPLLRVVPIATTQHDVNAAFQQAARNVLFDNEKILQKFSLVVDYKESVKPKKLGSTSDSQPLQGEIGWTSLQLEHKVDWPLHILLDTDVLNRYDGLFVFLLYVKRVQLGLQQCWALQMHRKHMHTLDTHSSKWWLRNHMAFLVDNLQYYLQVDVIESQFTILHDKIHSTKDFEAIRHAHHTFLSKLRSQSFIPLDDEEKLNMSDEAKDISQKRVYKCLCEILDMCHRFCLVVSNADVTMSDTENSQLEEIAKEFVRQSNLLFMLLSSARSHQSSPHLAQLLLRVDYNKYFTQAGGKLGSYGTMAAETKTTPALSSRRT